MRVPQVHRLVQRVLEARRLLLATARLVLPLLLLLVRRQVRVLLHARRRPEPRVSLAQRRPVPEHAHLGEELRVLAHLALERRGDRDELLAARVGMRRRLPAKGDRDDGQHAVAVPLAVEPLELLDADEGFGWQLLAPAQNTVRVRQVHEV